MQTKKCSHEIYSCKRMLIFADERQLSLLLDQTLWMSRSMNFADEKLLTGQLQETKDKGKCRRRKSLSDKSDFPLYWKVRVNTYRL